MNRNSRRGWSNSSETRGWKGKCHFRVNCRNGNPVKMGTRYTHTHTHHKMVVLLWRGGGQRTRSKKKPRKKKERREAVKASSVGIPDRPWLLSHSFQQLSLRFLERPSYKHSSIVSLFFLFKNPESDRTKIRKREREREALDFKWELNTQHIYIYIHREERERVPSSMCGVGITDKGQNEKSTHTHNKKKRSSRSWTSKPQQGPFKEIGKSLFSRLLLLWNCFCLFF